MRSEWSKRGEINVDRTIDVLETMLCHGKVYSCRDYIGRRRARKESFASSSSCEKSPCLDDRADPDEDIDALCREKMCEWSYRVSEHFRTSREIVAISQTFLDRFVDRCSCDRTAFKLAAMTTLFMATKMFNAKQISIQSLADLSRGEFEESHIAEMERIIIETLDWRLNPPTSQAFINSFHDILMIPQTDETARLIHQRSSFFAELAVYDYNFVTEEPCIVAVGALLNAFESLEESGLRDDLHVKLVDYILPCELNFQIKKTKLDRIRARLWYLYSCSEQVLDDGSYSACRKEQPSCGEPLEETTSREGKMHSPVSVKGLKNV